MININYWSWEFVEAVVFVCKDKCYFIILFYFSRPHDKKVTFITIVDYEKITLLKYEINNSVLERDFGIHKYDRIQFY